VRAKLIENKKMQKDSNYFLARPAGWRDGKKSRTRTRDVEFQSFPVISNQFQSIPITFGKNKGHNRYGLAGQI
jgi:hypothetical protein